VISALKLLAIAFSFGDGSGAVAAHIRESAELSVCGSRDHEGLAGHVGREEVTNITNVLRPTDPLPAAAENVRSVSAEKIAL